MLDNHIQDKLPISLSFLCKQIYKFFLNKNLNTFKNIFKKDAFKNIFKKHKENTESQMIYLNRFHSLLYAYIKKKDIFYH